MNLFWKSLLGGIASTSKLEKEEAALLQSMQRYAEVEKSAELAEFRSLFHEVKAPEFIEKKKILQNRKYKDTEEQRDSVKFHKLEKSAEIKLYYQVLSSKELVDFLAFKATPEFEDLGDKKKVQASPKLQKLKDYSKSKAYKTYTRFHDSYIIKEYEELKAHVNTPEFKQQNQFWANSHRWQTTPEYKKEQRYYELAKNPDIAFYNNTKKDKFSSYATLKLTFQEEFNWNTLDKSRWNFGFHYVSENLTGNHSFSNELQANNGGKNIAVENGILKIYTKKETLKSTAWDASKGFVRKDFEYSSDVMQTAEDFKQKYGIFRAKIRCTGKLHHAFWLGTDTKLPHINIFHYNGKQIRVGNAGSNVIDGVKIKGISPSKFYIYTLKWTPKELIWLINDVEIYRTTSNIPQEEMFLVFNSFIPSKMKGDAGTLEVDWVRVYA